MIEDIEDDYDDYPAEEAGYAWDAWDVLTAGEIKRHDAIVHASADELAKLDPAGLDDLDRWAYARASRRLADEDGFLDAVRLILTSGEEHRALERSEIFGAAIDAMARSGAHDEAALHLAAARKQWPDDPAFEALAVVVAARRDAAAADPAVDEFMQKYSADSEALFELAEDLVALEQVEPAKRLLDGAEAAARKKAASTLVDIQLLRSKLG